ncbi:hypothetical protein CDAR_67711 [Caerostris darwini]|uniref:Uncharacterized protein n=1 Tax=Caerostris darwini TaxID=1538125 RepID=A0AAV4TE21_9ARAC|nr:hypothetical protein CDAR_67711 [Caerostris darwini]
MLSVRHLVVFAKRFLIGSRFSKRSQLNWIELQVILYPGEGIDKRLWRELNSVVLKQLPFSACTDCALVFGTLLLNTRPLKLSNCFPCFCHFSLFFYLWSRPGEK